MGARLVAGRYVRLGTNSLTHQAYSCQVQPAASDQCLPPPPFPGHGQAGGQMTWRAPPSLGPTGAEPAHLGRRQGSLLVGDLPTAPLFPGLPIGRMRRGDRPRDRPPSVPLCRWVELGTVCLMDREDSSLLRAQEMISMQMRCKLLNEFAIRSPSLPGPGNAFGFYEWAGSGRGRRRAGPPPQLPVSAPATCRAARCCLPARRNLAARQRVSCSGPRGRLSARVPATLPAGVALGPRTHPLGPG